MNIEQLMVPEKLMLIGIFLLSFIALLLLVLIRMIRKLISLLSALKSVQPTTGEQLGSVTANIIPEEDLAVITAVITKMLPGVNLGAIQIDPVSN